MWEKGGNFYNLHRSILKIRPYIRDHDYESLEKWIDSEKVHALWCANLIPYPMTKSSFHHLLDQGERDWKDSAYVATEDDGTMTGFFCCCVDGQTNTGFLKFVIVDPQKRGHGFGQTMLRMALHDIFYAQGAESVQLNVFAENAPAKHCYEKAGFAERSVEQNVFPYQGALWSRCNMIAFK